MFSVVRQQVVPAPLLATWALVTDARFVSEWFADCERLAPGEPFRLEFGDGDFFAGRVTAWDEPYHLALRWRFMDAGPWFTIEYDLEEDGQSTLVTVHDTGAITKAEADGLGEGWADFLARLAARARTGAPARYRWSPAIATAAIMPAPLTAAAAVLHTEGWWDAAFPVAEVRLVERTLTCVVAHMAEPGWDNATTRIEVDLLLHRRGTYIGIVHSGWDVLPEATQLATRRRYAERWAGLLKRLEVSAPQPVPVGTTH